jgi:hypothetical protein
VCASGYKDDALRLAISRTVAKETPRGLQLTERSVAQDRRGDALAMAAKAAVEGARTSAGCCADFRDCIAPLCW